MKKTNAQRLLEAAKIPFETLEYRVDESDLSGEHIARELGLEPELVFKTLVLKGEKNGFAVCCIPANGELDLKKVAAVAGEKKIEMIPEKTLLSTTGYIRGGCSPVGMKKKFPTFFDETAQLFDEIYVSGGVRGMSIKIKPDLLINYVDGKMADLIK
ncbi:MAG: Cys-tRNA(Pro) deacylase [Clostridia bacterium]|nr:Cys-tRNA(Pro) deacylase [Clostridia bacterium]